MTPPPPFIRAFQPTYGMGFFTWSVPDNLLFGDSQFAEIYELDEDAVAAGIPVEAILDRIAQDDRERMAEKIHKTILDGSPSVSEYAIHLPSGKTRTVIAFGRCLHDSDGVPSFYTGGIMLADDASAAVDGRSLEMHCRAAIAIARNEGKELTVRYLSSALRSLGISA